MTIPMIMNTRHQYGLISRGLHWAIFILVLGLLLAGVTLDFLPDSIIKGFVASMHKSFGVVVGLLMGGRLLWRIYNPRPVALGHHAVENYLADVVHVFLYTLLLLQPLVGILMSQAFGYPVTVFGLFSLPTIVWQSPQLGRFFLQCHTVIAVLLAMTIGVHACAALKHQFIDRDRTLMRMLKGK
jgi:cytochrome b561